MSVRVELPTLKLNLETEVENKELDSFLASVVDSIEKNAKKIEKLFGTLRLPTEQSPPPPASQKPYPLGGLSDPVQNVARRLGLAPEKVVGNNLFGFKGDKPQVFDPSRFKSAATAARALLFLYEVGLERKSVKYDEFQQAFDLSKIKGRKPSQVVGDWIKGAAIEAGPYKSSEDLVLSAKGASDAAEDLKAALA